MTKTNCPFCQLAHGISSEKLITKPEEIVHQDDKTTSFIGCDWWPNNQGHVIIIPNQHFENLYEISEEMLTAVYNQAQKIAKILKEEYKCDGISTRQHNEPAGNQTVFHYHVHVFPRYKDDNLYINNDNWFRADLKERVKYADRLKKHFKK